MFETREPKRGCVQEKQNRNLKQVRPGDWRGGLPNSRLEPVF